MASPGPSGTQCILLLVIWFDGSEFPKKIKNIGWGSVKMFFLFTTWGRKNLKIWEIREKNKKGLWQYSRRPMLLFKIQFKNLLAFSFENERILGKKPIPSQYRFYQETNSFLNTRKLGKLGGLFTGKTQSPPVPLGRWPQIMEKVWPLIGMFFR